MIPNKSVKILTREITYTQRQLVGFNILGLPVYRDVERIEIIRACSERELKLRVLQFQNYITSNNTYQYRRHPKKYIEVLP